jgi:hypothetical protein
MTTLPTTTGLTSLVDRRFDRQLDREIARARGHGAIVAARETAKLEAIAQVTEAALLATSHISAVEALLIERTPHAESRLRHIADAGCAGMANVVLRTGSRI